MALTTLPTTFPIDDVQYVIAEMTGVQSHDLKQTLASLYGVLGYAANQVIGGVAIPKLVGPVTVFHKQGLAANLTAAMNSGSVDWGQVIQIVLGLIQTYLAQHPIP